MWIRLLGWLSPPPLRRKERKRRSLSPSKAGVDMCCTEFIAIGSKPRRLLDGSHPQSPTCKTCLKKNLISTLAKVPHSPPLISLMYILNSFFFCLWNLLGEERMTINIRDAFCCKEGTLFVCVCVLCVCVCVCNSSISEGTSCLPSSLQCNLKYSFHV